MTEEQKQEREDWEALLASPGWARFVRQMDEQVTGSGAIVGAIRLAPAQAAVIVAVSDSVRSVIRHPQMRLTQLEGVAKREAR